MSAVRSAASLTSAAGRGSQTSVVSGAGTAAGESQTAGKLRRDQRVRDAIHVAGHTLKEGDKGGHSSGPKLGEE